MQLFIAWAPAAHTHPHTQPAFAHHYVKTLQPDVQEATCTKISESGTSQHERRLRNNDSGEDPTEDEGTGAYARAPLDGAAVLYIRYW